MTPEIVRLRRRIEALTEHLDEQAEQVAPGIWAVPSRSRPEDFHLVTRTPEGTIVCDCEGAKAGQPCRHAEAIAAIYERAAWRRQEHRKQAMPTEAFIDAMGGPQGALPANDDLMPKRPLPSSKHQLRKEVRLI